MEQGGNKNKTRNESLKKRKRGGVGRELNLIGIILKQLLLSKATKKNRKLALFIELTNIIKLGIEIIIQI